MLVPDAALLANGDTVSGFGKLQSCGGTYDAAAYDNDIDFFRKFRIALNMNWRGAGH
ncbi:hypothetical protein GCM10011326_44560 [Salipiger profundus]|nr:hypothetical protein GCM10011326_44560 [Salipiger profundus]